VKNNTETPPVSNDLSYQLVRLSLDDIQAITHLLQDPQVLLDQCPPSGVGREARQHSLAGVSKTQKRKDRNREQYRDTIGARRGQTGLNRKDVPVIGLNRSRRSLATASPTT
jgi:hypothetical protein